MKAAYLLEFPTLLGAERSWLAALPHLSGVEPLAVARPAGPLAETLSARGVPLLPFAWHKGDPESRAAELAPLLRGRGVALVHANSLTTSLCAPALGEALACPAVGHARDIMRLSRARVDRLNRLGRLVCVSVTVARALQDQGVRPAVLEVVHNGIDACGEFDPAEVPDRLSVVAGLSPGSPVMGFVGQLVQRKDPRTFLEAFHRVRETHPCVRAVVIGARHSDKAEAVEYEAGLHALAGSGALFLGERSDVPSLVRGMSVVVNASRQEPLSRVILEAMALARPVVATDVGGTREMIEDGETGLLVPPADPDAMAEALSRILVDPILGRRLAEAGRRSVLARFTPQACASGILSVYQSLFGESTGRF